MNTIYKVNRGFMAFQFGDKPTYCIGIECRALNNAGEYHCEIGKEKRRITVTLQDIDNLIAKYGKDNVIRKAGGKYCYIVPVNEMQNNVVDSSRLL